MHVVIIGFAAFDVGGRKPLFEYPDGANPTVQLVSNINPYLVEGNNLTVPTRSRSICRGAPEMMKGSEATDDGHLILTDAEKAELLNECAEMDPYVRRFVGGKEYINGLYRWCLWLPDAAARLIRASPFVMERLERVRQFRAASPKERTVGLAATPGIFGEIRQPTAQYLIIPKVSSERRRFIPIGFVGPEVIANGSALVVPDASLYQFGIISSTMHMAWMRQICGRMKSDYQYSVSIVYNNFGWPQTPNARQVEAIEAAAQNVLEIRNLFQDNTLSDLYDPLAMPPGLVIAHAVLDRAVELCYRPQQFTSDRQRVEYLFMLYEQITAPLLPGPPRRRRRAAA